jgi:paired amphipathic helix protein Sin3a
MGRHDQDRRDQEAREREREREMRERNNMEMHRHQEEMMMRERDRAQMERMHREQLEQRPVQSAHAGSIPIHQPVASKVQNSIHGPNGLLSNGGAGTIAQNGPPASSGSLYGVSAPEQQRSQFIHQQGVPPSQQPAPAFLGGPSPMPQQAQLASGQQPILNVSQHLAHLYLNPYICGC